MFEAHTVAIGCLAGIVRAYSFLFRENFSAGNISPEWTVPVVFSQERCIRGVGGVTAAKAAVRKSEVIR